MNCYVSLMSKQIWKSLANSLLFMKILFDNIRRQKETLSEAFELL